MMGCRVWSPTTILLLFGLLLAARSSKTDEDEVVDPYAWDYDRTTKTNRGTDSDWIKPGGKADCSSDLLKRACSDCGYGPMPEGSLPEKLCNNDLNLFRHVTRSLSEHFDENPETDSLLLTLTHYQREKLLKFVNGKDVSKVDVLDMLRTSWSVPYDPGSSVPVTILGFTPNEMVVGILILLLSASIFVMALTFRVSFLRVMVALCFTAMVMSFLWSYMFLYQRAIAKRMSDDAIRGQYNESCQSSEKASFLGGIRRFFRRGDDPCEKYFHDHQVHIALEVLPVEAITHTLGAIMTSLSGFFGTSLAEISGKFLGGLSIAMWLPAFTVLLITLVAVLAVCLYCGGRRHPVVIREQDALQVEPPAQRYALDDGSRDDARDGARYRNRGDNRLEEAYPPRYAIRDSIRDDSYNRNRDGDRTSATGLRQRNNDALRARGHRMISDVDRFEGAHFQSDREDRIDEIPPQRYAGEWADERYDRRHVERGLEGPEERSRGYSDRREDEFKPEQRRLNQAGGVRDQEGGYDPHTEVCHGRHKQVSEKEKRDRLQETASRGAGRDNGREMVQDASSRSATRGSMRDLEQRRTHPEDEGERGAYVSGREGRVQEVGPEGQNGAGDQKELKNGDQSPVKPLPDSTGVKDKHPESSETTGPPAAEEFISEDDFEVIPEE